MSLAPAPSAPPTSIKVTNITTASITVQWGPVDCIQRNGDITGYSVQYGVITGYPVQYGYLETESLEKSMEQTVNVGPTTGEAGELTITELRDYDIYYIAVAAVNRANTGVYSNPVIAKTKRKLLKTIK